jgi:lysophospholipase L1-like esterase
MTGDCSASSKLLIDFKWVSFMMGKKNVYGLSLFPYLMVLLISCPGMMHAQLPANVHKVLFLGASITYAGNYVTDMEAYYKVHYPRQAVEFINLGLPSETVSGLSEPGHAGNAFPRPDLHERFDRILARIKPDIVITSYGINDGIYMKFAEERFDKFREGMLWLDSRLRATGARVIHLTPSVYDGFVAGNFEYQEVIDLYAHWLLKQRKVSGWEVVDVYHPMKKYLEAHRKVDRKFALKGFELAKDGVHIGETGHWIMARGILDYLGEKGVATAPDINATLKIVPGGSEILSLIAQRQIMMKDAWLTATGHKRPGMTRGLLLDEARQEAAKLERRIMDLLEQK